MGTAVAVFKETLCISVVNELEIPCKEYQYRQTYLVQPGEEHRAVRITGGTIVHFMVAPNGTLSVAFNSNTQQEKNDRVVLTRVNPMLMKPRIEWGAFVTSFVSPSLNRLKELIEKTKRFVVIVRFI